MNRLIIALASISALLGAGCVSNPPAAPYAIADWQVRCDSVMGMCAVPLARSITGENGTSGNGVSCLVSESDTDRTLNVTVGGTATDGTRFQVQVLGARVPRGGGSAAAAGCSTVVTEGANRYSGGCGGGAPSMEQPCQVMVDFGYDTDVMTPTASMRVLCDHLPNAASADQLRGLSAPGGAGMPAEFVLFSCTGLTAD